MSQQHSIHYLHLLFYFLPIFFFSILLYFLLNFTWLGEFLKENVINIKHSPSHISNKVPSPSHILWNFNQTLNSTVLSSESIHRVSIFTIFGDSIHIGCEIIYETFNSLPTSCLTLFTRCLIGAPSASVAPNKGSDFTKWANLIIEDSIIIYRQILPKHFSYMTNIVLFISHETWPLLEY